jgi:hypothetical protein
MSAPAGRRSRALLLMLVCLGGLAAGIVLTRRFRQQSDRPGAATPTPALAANASPEPEKAATFEVASATGTVEAQRDGRWVAINQGDTLTRTDVVRTQAGGRAVLRFSAGTEIELRERVEIGLDRIAGRAAVDLRRGKLFARVSASDALDITAQQTKTSNEGFARLVVLADEQGRVSVATLEGAARFSAAGKSVALPAGTESRSQAGSPPQDPERIPEDVFLNVVWPSERPGGDTAIEGRASPSSVVTVNGALAPVGKDGRFSTTVTLREGKNVVEVQAEDLAGKTKRASTTIVRRPPKPALTPEATDLWKK